MFRIAGRRGKSLKALRLDTGIHQIVIADRLGVTTAYLSCHENEHGGFGLPRGFGRRYQEELQTELRERGYE